MSRTERAAVGEQVAGRYEVIRALGGGAMGSVYEVRHCSLGRRFALKTLADDLCESAEGLARLRREAEIVASLRHPSIVDVVDWVALDDGSPAIVMELLEGEDLGQHIARRGALDWAVVGRIGDAIMAALGCAHAAGIVHRDLKPGNVFLARDDSGEVHPKLLDFGLSRMWAEPRITSAGTLVGTPMFMSPEQAIGNDDVGADADVWAMGGILFTMASGRHAFDAPTRGELLHRIVYGHPERVDEHRADVPAPFAELIARALSRDPARRIRSIRELRLGCRSSLAPVAPEAFTRPLVLDGDETAITAMVVPAPEAGSNNQEVTPPPARAPSSRRRGAALAGAGALLGLVAMALLGGRSASTSHPAPTRSVQAPRAAATAATPPAGKRVAAAPPAESAAAPPAEVVAGAPPAKIAAAARADAQPTPTARKARPRRARRSETGSPRPAPVRVGDGVYRPPRERSR